MSGQKKMIPRLLGISRDSIIRADVKTKEFLKIWPLKTIKSWSVSLNSPLLKLVRLPV